jgi:hypothetical protein
MGRLNLFQCIWNVPLSVLHNLHQVINIYCSLVLERCASSTVGYPTMVAGGCGARDCD